MEENLQKDYCPVESVNERPFSEKTSIFLVILVFIFLAISSGLGYLIASGGHLPDLFPQVTISPTPVSQPTVQPILTPALIE